VNKGGFTANRAPKNGYPDPFSIEFYPRESSSITVYTGFTVRAIKEYKATLKKFPNPPTPNLTDC